MTDTKRLRRNRVRVVLICGIVVGIVVAVILSGWNDMVRGGSGSEGAQVFLEADTGDGWSEHRTPDTSAVLRFPAEPLAPGSTVFAPIALRVSPLTTIRGLDMRVYLKGAVETTGDLVEHLRYTVRVDVPSDACDADGFATIGGTPRGFPYLAPLDAGSGDGYLVLPSPGGYAELCFAVTLLPDAPETDDLRGSAMWQFVGEISDPNDPDDQLVTHSRSDTLSTAPGATPP